MCLFGQQRLCFRASASICVLCTAGRVGLRMCVKFGDRLWLGNRGCCGVIGGLDADVLIPFVMEEGAVGFWSAAHLVPIKRWNRLVYSLLQDGDQMLRCNQKLLVVFARSWRIWSPLSQTQHVCVPVCKHYIS